MTVKLMNILIYKKCQTVALSAGDPSPLPKTKA